MNLCDSVKPENRVLEYDLGANIFLPVKASLSLCVLQKETRQKFCAKNRAQR
jgi:hypothetical protein